MITNTMNNTIGNNNWKIETEARGTVLRVSVTNGEDKEKILNLKKLSNGLAVKVSEHPTANKVRAVVIAPECIDDTEDEIRTGLEKYNVISVKRISRREGGTIKNTPTLIITLEGTYVPEVMYYHYVTMRTRTYYPAPMRCFQCFAFGHTRAKCTAAEICGNCSKTAHTAPGVQCNEEKHCKTCKSNEHNVASRKCPVYIKENETQKIKTDRHVTYPEAKRIWEKENKTKTYANITAQECQNASVDKLVAVIKEKDDEINKLKNQDNSNLALQMKQLRDEIASLASVISQQKNQINKLEADNAALQLEKSRNSRTTNANHMEQIEAKEIYIKKLEEKVQSKNEIIEKQQLEMSHYRDNLNLLAHEYKSQSPFPPRTGPVPVIKRKFDNQNTPAAPKDKRSRSPMSQTNESSGDSEEDTLMVTDPEPINTDDSNTPATSQQQGKPKTRSRNKK